MPENVLAEMLLIHHHAENMPAYRGWKKANGELQRKKREWRVVCDENSNSDPDALSQLGGNAMNELSNGSGSCDTVFHQHSLSPEKTEHKRLPRLVAFQVSATKGDNTVRSSERPANARIFVGYHRRPHLSALSSDRVR